MTQFRSFSTPVFSSSPRNAAILALLIGLITLAVYHPATHNNFVDYDDPYYVTQNTHVHDGLTWNSLRWALTSFEAENWHPLTWISHMADARFFQLDPAAHHRTSIWMHALNAALLFLLLNRMTGALWRSALVAALFALHPLNVESVAWVAERKNVLSTLFWILTLWAYVTYSRNSSLRNYATLVIVFALGLMAKPMLVTLPFVLLLLDYWPLRRLTLGSSPAAEALPDRTPDSPPKNISSLLVEKIPLVALALLSSFVTIKAQSAASATIQALPLSARVANAVVSYAAYMFRAIWPANLAVLYPHPLSSVLLSWHLPLAIAVMAVCSFLVWRQFKKRPYLLVGWLWFVGTLVPVIGILQVGLQARADRYAYVPLIGLFLVVSWGLAEVVRTLPSLRMPIASLCVLSLLALAVDTRKQISYWHDTATLFSHALEVTKDNYIAHMILAAGLDSTGDHEGALAHYFAGLKIDPKNGSIHYNIGRIKLKQNKPGEAEAYFREALKFPNSPSSLAIIHDRLAFVLDRRDQFKEAEAEYKAAIRLHPEESYYSRLNLGVLLARRGRFEDAAEQYLQLIREAPTEASLYFLLGEARQQQGRFSEAADAYRKTLEIQPHYAPAQIKLKAVLPQLPATTVPPQ